MRIFLDANVLISVLNQEYPLFTLSSRIVSLADHPDFEVYTSPLCLGIAFYFAEKKSGRKKAREKIAMLSQNVRISALNEQIVQQAIGNPQIQDFEDGLEYYSAMNSKCELIITEDIGDFYFSEINVANCERFIQSLDR